MATATLAPDTSTARILDPVSFDEASLLFAETGLPVSARSLLRWAKEDNLPLSRRGRAWVASYSDLLVAHGRRHPEPGQ